MKLINIIHCTSTCAPPAPEEEATADAPETAEAMTEEAALMEAIEDAPDSILVAVASDISVGSSMGGRRCFRRKSVTSSTGT